MIPKEKFLITGAGGFIGGWIVETLHLWGEVDIRAGIRNWMSAARLSRFPVDITLCNVLDKMEIAQAMKGVDIVIHCASGSGEIIVQGTQNMLDTASRLGIRRFIHLSTAEVYGNQTGDIDESHPFQESGNSYGKAKIEAEKLCRKYSEKGLPVTVIRPSIVYGPFSKDWTVGLAQSLQSRNWGILEGIGDGICNLIYISDLVSGILIAARHEAALGEAFNMSGPDIVTWNQYFQKFNAALGLPELRAIRSRKARLYSGLMKPVRSSAKFLLAHFASPLKKISQRYRPARIAMKAFEKKMKTTPQSDEFSLYSRNAVYLSAKARDLLGFQPKFDLDTGLALTVSWLNQLGLTDSPGLGSVQKKDRCGTKP
jgi:nucleoside-diphosphate-sugar epimerase